MVYDGTFRSMAMAHNSPSVLGMVKRSTHTINACPLVPNFEPFSRRTPEFFDDLLLENEDFSLLEYISGHRSCWSCWWIREVSPTSHLPAQVEEVLELLAEAVWRDGCGFLFKSLSPAASGCRETTYVFVPLGTLWEISLGSEYLPRVDAGMVSPPWPVAWIFRDDCLFDHSEAEQMEKCVPAVPARYARNYQRLLIVAKYRETYLRGPTKSTVSGFPQWCLSVYEPHELARYHHHEQTRVFNKPAYNNKRS